MSDYRNPNRPRRQPDAAKRGGEPAWSCWPRLVYRDDDGRFMLLCRERRGSKSRYHREGLREFLATIN